MAIKESNRQKVDALTFDTIPNRITLLRLAASPLVVYFLFQRTLPGDIAACALFVLAALTDWLDGYLARAYQAVTVFGKLIDPLADKFLVVMTLVMLQHLDRIHPFFVMVLVCREMAITSLRALASSEGIIISAGTGGKWKATLQMVAIPFLILPISFSSELSALTIGTWLLAGSLVLSLTSASTYTRDFFRSLQEKRKLKDKP